WRDIDGARAGAALEAGFDVESLVVDRDRDETGPRQRQGPLRAEIARILDPDRAAALEEHAAREGEGLLRAADDHDLRGLASNGARRAQVLGDGLAQDREAHRVVVGGSAGVEPAAVTGDQARPDPVREMIEGSARAVERLETREPGSRLVVEKLPGS